MIRRTPSCRDRTARDMRSTCSLWRNLTVLNATAQQWFTANAEPHSFVLSREPNTDRQENILASVVFRAKKFRCFSMGPRKEFVTSFEEHPLPCRIRLPDVLQLPQSCHAHLSRLSNLPATRYPGSLLDATSLFQTFILLSFACRVTADAATAETDSKTQTP